MAEEEQTKKQENHQTLEIDISSIELSLKKSISYSDKQIKQYINGSPNSRKIIIYVYIETVKRRKQSHIFTVDNISSKLNIPKTTTRDILSRFNIYGLGKYVNSTKGRHKCFISDIKSDMFVSIFDYSRQIMDSNR